MITQHGPICDVCGDYILTEPGLWFRVAQIPHELCCHEKCKQPVIDATGAWEKLPDGPLRKAFAAAAKAIEDAGKKHLQNIQN